MAMTRHTDRDLNAILTQLMGRPMSLRYRGLNSHGLAPGAKTNVKNGRVWVDRTAYRALAGAPAVSPAIIRAVAFLAHELGHYDPRATGYQGTPNDTGGVDWNPDFVENAADDWARKNMRRVYNALGYRPHQARGLTKKSIADLKAFREEIGL